MLLLVKDLKPNPFRRIDRYPINREKVEILKTSINETDFWDNLLARKNGDGYEIAYGHHRLIALRELGIKEIDIPVRKLDNGLMIKIMANENLNEWSSNPLIIDETVAATKEFLEKELAKYESWETLPDNLKKLLENENKTTQFGNLKTKGVTTPVLFKFLGGNWSEWVIQEALENIRENPVINREAVESFPTMGQSKAFKDAIKFEKNNGNEISFHKQKKIADVIAKEGLGRRDIPIRVHQINLPFIKERAAKYRIAGRPKLEDTVRETIGYIRGVQSKLETIIIGAHIEEGTSFLEYVNPSLRERFIIEADKLKTLLTEICSKSDKQQIIREAKDV